MASNNDLSAELVARGEMLAASYFQTTLKSLLVSSIFVLPKIYNCNTSCLA